MPKGVYVRTEENIKNIGEAKRKWARENPERAREITVEAGKTSARKNNTLKDLWENNREMMMGHVYKNCVQAGRQSNSLKKLWENNRDEMINVVCSKAGKIGGRNNWKKHRTKMLGVVKKACGLGGPIAIQKQQKLFPSPIELIVRDFLDELKIKYQPNVWFPYNGTRKEADIVIPKLNLIIECDGFRHSFPENKNNDKLKTKLFNKLGYKVLRLKGPEIRNGSFENKVLNKIDQIKSKEQII